MVSIKRNIILFLLLISISHVLPKLLGEGEDNAQKFEIGANVQFSYQKNRFKFDFQTEKLQTIIFAFHNEIELSLNDSEGNIIEIEREKHNSLIYHVNITENGTYYMSIEGDYPLFYFGDFFNSFIPETTKQIDLSEKIYYNELDFSTNIPFKPTKYKISNLTEEKYVFFAHLKYDKYRDYENIDITFFEICKGEKQECKQNIPIYKFEPETDYTIYFYLYDRNYYYSAKDPEPDKTDHNVYKANEPYSLDDIEQSEEMDPTEDIDNEEENDGESEAEIEPDTSDDDPIETDPMDDSDSDSPDPSDSSDEPYPDPDYDKEERYQYPRYAFFPISSNIIQNIDEGIYSFEEPKIFMTPIDEKSRKIYTESKYFKYYAQTSENISQNLTLLSELKFKNCEEELIETSSGNYTLFILIPLGFKNKTKFISSSELDEEYKEEYIIHAGKSKIIYITEVDFNFMYNPVYIFTSNKKLYLSYSDDTEGTDLIIINSGGFPIYAPKSDEEYKVKVTLYNSKYAFYGVINPYLFETYKSYARKAYLNGGDLNLLVDNYLDLIQMNLRVNSNYLPWQEFYNFYLKDLNIKINAYIRKIYGNSELYECSADSVDFKNLTFLTAPITECKNKKSVFNRVLNLDGTKILSGYIGYQSYFDIYVEIDNDNKIIDNNNIGSFLLPFLKGNTAKFLKKDVEYTISFSLNHIIKLDPVSPAEVTIKNKDNTYTLNSNTLYKEINGDGFTIKSNKDAMVYFLGRFTGTQIKIENKPGKVIRISNLKDKDDFVIDFGFNGFNPSCLNDGMSLRENGTLYLDNLYELSSTKLIEGEDLYIYFFDELREDEKPKIEYIGYNINNKNNEFNIFYVDRNNDNTEENQNLLIVNNYDSLFSLYGSVIFCQKDTSIEMLYQGYEGEMKYEFNNYNNETYNLTIFQLLSLDNKFRFKSNESFVFSYSIFEKADKYFNYSKQDSGREIMNNLTIIGVNSKNKDNMINIEFLPTYKNSLARYIIILAKKNEKNTIENFNNLCFIAKLLKDKPQDVIINSLYNPGKTDSIFAEIDIANIEDEKGEYIMNIISQELRYDKKTLFYSALQFKYPYEKKDSNPDGKDDKNGGNTTTVLAIVLPIVGLIVILLIIFFVLRCRKSSSPISKDEIEKLTGHQELE